MLDMIEDYVATGDLFSERTYPIAAVCELITETFEGIEAHALSISEEIAGINTLTSRSQQQAGRDAKRSKRYFGKRGAPTAT